MISDRVPPETGQEKHVQEMSDANSSASDCSAASFVTEAQAYAAFGHVLEDKELRHARQEGRIGFMRRKRTIFYRYDELSEFVDRILEKDYVPPCQESSRHSNRRGREGSSNMGDTGSTRSQSHRITTTSDTIETLERMSIERLARGILMKRRRSSSTS
jgi:hypothetical protein